MLDQIPAWGRSGEDHPVAAQPGSGPRRDPLLANPPGLLPLVSGLRGVRSVRLMPWPSSPSQRG